MIHYTCDRCCRPLQADETTRYVVKMEIEAAIDPSEQETAEDEQDCLLALDHSLERMESELEDEPLMVFQRKRFDLCPECYRKFIKNPMGKEKLQPFGFSHN